jgi:SSS family solute:Na+ symporter
MIRSNQILLAIAMLFGPSSLCLADGGKPTVDESPFHLVDYLVVLGYLAILVWMGFFFAKRNKTTDDFFLAGRRIPWWAATMSIFSTQLSAVTFMAIPASAYGKNWTSILINLGIILVAPICIFCFLPFYRRLKVTSIYEYLEMRFGPGIRIYGSISFAILQVAKMGVFLILPSLALATITGLPLYGCIVAMGLLCTFYTVLGGIEAVVWTDVLQTVVLVGGGLLCVGMIIASQGFDIVGMWEPAVEQRKFHVFTTVGEWGLTSNAFWVWIVGGFFIQLVPFTSDQVPMQRLLTTPDEKSAARAIWMHAIAVVPASLLFFGLGTALFVFYTANPVLLEAVPSDDNAIVPWFIAHQLPVGLAGLVIAGLFAATMSTVDSGMHSISTSLVTDIYSKTHPSASDEKRLRMARIITVVAGLLGTVSAFVVSQQDPKYLWGHLLLLMALFGSTLTGVFLLGVFTKRANSRGVAIGVVASVGALIAIRLMDKEDRPVHGVLTAAVGVLICMIVGYIASIMLPGPSRSMQNVTLAELDLKEEQG